ncbi:MAG: aromatic-ring-hydroxylating dioxygenase subunit beta [Proteobacteria bacterium]|nr:aromatic-ring-hydroxylating dioxygenase subunit beta [Pseudomonadota bacterium]
MTARPFERARIEDFLYREAALLDSWKLMEWVELFTEDGEYLVPSTDIPDGSPADTLFLIYDDHHRLAERAKRLLKKTAHAEFPHSRLRRIVGNVLVDPPDNESIRVTCSFVVFRSRLQRADIYPGHSMYDLVAGGPLGFRIRRKRAVLDSDDLREQGKLSIIL